MHVNDILVKPMRAKDLIDDLEETFATLQRYSILISIFLVSRVNGSLVIW